MITPTLLGITALLAFPTVVTAQTVTRQLAGVVTDQHHEPIKGAVVQVENQNTEAVNSYTTGADGHYLFKRLDGNTDYRVWTTYRGKMSKRRFLSKFNSKPALSINLTVRYP